MMSLSSMSHLTPDVRNLVVKTTDAYVVNVCISRLPLE